MRWLEKKFFYGWHHIRVTSFYFENQEVDSLVVGVPNYYFLSFPFPVSIKILPLQVRNKDEMRKIWCMKWVMMLLLAVLFGACTRVKSPFSTQNAPHHFKELRSVEELLETNSTLALDSVNVLSNMAEKHPFTILDDNELRLCIVQAQYKNRCLSETSPDLTPVIAFYDSLSALYPEDFDLQFLLANAYYYKGVEFAYADDDVDAFRCYLHTLEVMQTPMDWENYPRARRFIALTYTRLSEILYRYGLNDLALETCQKAFSYYESEVDKAAMMRYEAAIYQSEKEYDKALARFQEADDRAAVSDNFIQMSLGGRLFELKQYDSAVPHLERAFATGDRFARVDAAAKLAEISRDKGLTDNELRYTRYYVENSLLESRMASKKMEVEYLYDSFKHPEEKMVTTNNSMNRSTLFLVVLLLVIIALMIFIIVRNRKRIMHIENKITSIEQKHEQEAADKDLEIEQISKQLSDTRERLENINESIFEEAWKAFMDSAIVMKIRGLVEGKDIMIKNVGVYPKLKLKEMDYISLVQEANRCFPDFSSRMLKDYPELTATDLRHSCLALLGLNDAEIAVLEGLTYSGANRRTNKILTVLDKGDNLEQALLTYLKELY